MHSLISLFNRVPFFPTFVAILLCCVGAGRIQADPILITLEPGGTDPTDLTTLSPFELPEITGTSLEATLQDQPVTKTYRNATKVTWTDLEFTTNIPQDSVIQGAGDGFFHGTASSTTSLTFFVTGSDPGIAPGVEFTIISSGFKSGTKLKGTPTVPEPSTRLVMGAGLLALIVGRRKILQLSVPRGEIQ
jgi:PEP-CTERM motif